MTLPTGYLIGDYTIQGVIGSGSFGITYKAHDGVLDRTVAIKEYFPFEHATRENTLNVSPRTSAESDVEAYETGLKNLLEEAKHLARCEHPNILRVLHFLESNNTAYIVMQFIEGQDLAEYLQTNGLLSISQAKKIILSVAEGLAMAHEQKVMHRDIKPANIRIRDDLTPVLIDFGAAKQAIGQQSRSIESILTHGFAPYEQYSTRGNQGPWTDIYALAMTGYVSLTGINILEYEGVERIVNDTMPKLSSMPELVDPNDEEKQKFLAMLDWGLMPDINDRPQSIAEWMTALDKPVPASVISQPVNPSISQKTRKVTGSANKSIGSSVVNKVKSVAEKKQVESTGSRKRSENKSSAKGNSNKLIIYGAVATFVFAGFLFYKAFDTSSKSGDGNIVVINEKLDKTKTDVAKVKSEVKQVEVKPRKQEPIKQEPIKPKVASLPKQEPILDLPSPINPKDDEDFKKARFINTKEAYEIYMRLHPNGRHINNIP